MTANDEPHLEAPGAGLPPLELRIARLLFAFRRWTGNQGSFTAHFQREREAIRQLIRSCDAETGARRVLIKRPPGLEDSSRYWSVWMTLDHLRMVNNGIARTIGALTQGIVPPGKASTAAVKPSPETGTDIADAYEGSCEAVLSAVAATSTLKTAARFTHPWFGALDAAGWHAMAGTHLGLHRVQLERIIAGLV